MSNGWAAWMRRPQKVWLRRALFQVHLWTGVGVGLYVLLMSVTGSAIVFRREITRSLAQEPRVLIGPGPRLSEDELKQIAQRAYPGFVVPRISLRKNPDQAAEVWLERGKESLQRLFNPYTGADLGNAIRWQFRFVLWVVDLHDNLLLGPRGRVWNAAGGFLTLALVLTGAVIWWPGMESWKRSLSFGWKKNPKGFNWAMHSALGFWTLAFSFMWALSGVYLSMPNVFSSTVDFLEPLNPASRSLRFGDQVLFWLAQAHFGRFAGTGTKIAWTALGLAPGILFVTGFLMWWNRVVVPWRLRGEVRSAQSSAAQSADSLQARS